MLPAYQLPQRTRNFCRLLKWFIIVVIFSYGFIVVWTSHMDATIDLYWRRLGETEPQIRDIVTNGVFKKWLLQALAFIKLIIPVSVFLAAANLFAKFQTGEVFTKRTLAAIRLLAGTILLSGLSQVIMYSAFIGALTYDNPKGQRLLSFSINSSQILTIIISFIFMIIAIIFSEAVRQSDENRQIV